MSMVPLARFRKQYIIILVFASVSIFVTMVMISRWPSWNEVKLIDKKAGRSNPDDSIELNLKQRDISRPNVTQAPPLHAYNSSTMEMADHVPTEIALAPMQDENSFVSKSTPAINLFTQKPLKDSYTQPVQKNSMYTAFPAKPDKDLNVLSITKIKPPKLLTNYKNPCWLKGDKPDVVRCIPYFYIAGFAKCGTTDLHYRVVGHPLIVPGRVKESHYLTRLYYSSFKPSKLNKTCHVHCGTGLYSKMFYKEASKAISIANPEKTFEVQMRTERKHANQLSNKFLERFPDESRALLEKSQEHYMYPMITEDSSPSTAFYYNNWQQIEENEGLLEPRFITADWIKKINPKARIVMIVRDPIERSFSEYVYNARTNAKIEVFHGGIIDAITTLNACFKSGTPPLMCTLKKYNPVPFRLGVSLYHIHVKNLLDRFPRGQVLVLRFEDYIRNSSQILEQVYKFLDLPALSPDAMQFITSSEVINSTKMKSKLGEMKPETYEMLANFFKPHNEKLAQLLGDKRFLWND